MPQRGVRDNSARDALYDGQMKGYETCMRGWIAQAKSEISQIKADAETSMKQVTADANRQILEIWDTILEAVKQADVAGRNRSAALDALKAQLAAATPQPSSQRQQREPLCRRMCGCRVLRTSRRARAIRCNRLPQPQQLPGVHFMGPEICKRNREWAQLSKRGENLSPDGKKILESEKARTLAPDHCFSRTRFINGVPITETNCSQSAHGM
jgi:hypothetical protein